MVDDELLAVEQGLRRARPRRFDHPDQAWSVSWIAATQHTSERRVGRHAREIEVGVERARIDEAIWRCRRRRRGRRLRSRPSRSAAGRLDGVGAICPLLDPDAAGAGRSTIAALVHALTAHARGVEDERRCIIALLADGREEAAASGRPRRRGLRRSHAVVASEETKAVKSRDADTSRSMRSVRPTNEFRNLGEAKLGTAFDEATRTRRPGHDRRRASLLTCCKAQNARTRACSPPLSARARGRAMHRDRRTSVTSKTQAKQRRRSEAIRRSAASISHLKANETNVSR